MTTIAHASDQKAAPTAKNADKDSAPANHETVPTAQRQTGEVVRSQLEAEGWAVPAAARYVQARVERDTTGTDFGSAVHEVMERLPQEDALSIEDLCRLAVEQFNLKDEAYADVLAAARAFAESAPYKAAVAAEQAYFELPVLRGIQLPSPDGDGASDEASNEVRAKVAVNGYIDLLYKDGDSWVIADYKTDSHARTERVASYFLQLELYARTLSDALGAPVSRLELIFLDGSKGDLGTQVLVHER